MLLTGTLVVAAYVVGSVNVSIMVFRLLGAGDPRERFSGNAGVTNVYRQAGLSWAAFVLALDLGRAAATALAGLWLLTPERTPVLVLPLILGNRWPCFHGFRGGKGVANYLGFCAVLAPWAAVVAAVGWVAVYRATREPFLGSFAMTAVLTGGVMARCWGNIAATVAVLVTLVLILTAHRRNVREYLGRNSSKRRLFD
jgi:acyl phosphate:glycerol-3-phosphate acyltransferase